MHNSNTTGNLRKFQNCSSLVGGAGTVWDSTQAANIDGGPTARGYLTGNVIFDTGENINVKMKFLAGNISPTVDTENTTIRDFRYSSTINEEYKDDDHKISADNSYSPIYMWYEDGVIYWWSNCIKPKLNPDSSNMFKNMKGLTSLDLTPYYTGDVTNMSGMFYECSNIEEIWIGTRWVTDKVVDSTDMFYNCTKLVGIGGTTYNSNYVDKTYARPDNAIVEPGYFSGDAVFKSGESVNVAMKTLFGQSGATYSTSNTSIKTFKYSEDIDLENTIIVSAHNSIIPIYMWKDEAQGIVYWFSINKKPYVNGSAKYMFSYLEGLKSAELSYFDTSKVSDISYMFNNCSGIETLDLSNFNTSRVTTMDYMFFNCTNLVDLNLSSFDTSNVERTCQTFYGCSKLIMLDLSSFNTSKNTYPYKMFSNCSNLQTIFVGNEWSLNTNYIIFEGCTEIVGGAGTIYDSNNTKDTYAIVDGTDGNPGYLTGKAVFDIGENVNKKMKLLSGTINPTVDTQNTAILDIKYSSTITDEHKDDLYKVSAEDSDYPIYMWFEDGIIYWWSQSNKAMFNQNASSMFKNLNGLTNLDLRPFYARYVTDMSDMFNGCANIKEIWVDHGWNADKVTESTNMFNGCTNLVGVGGTQYNEEYIDKTYARPDKWIEEPGYLSADARLDTGETVNKAMKKIFGTASPTISTANTTIKAIEYSSDVDWDNKVKISEYSSILPIYIWKGEDNQTVYWYCANQHMYLNKNAKSMFRSFKGLTSLVSVNLDASKTRDMSEMFYDCIAVENVDLGCFNTENLTTMAHMFYNCSNLKNINISSFNTSKVTNMASVFYSCSALEKLNITNFDTSKVTNMSYMFYNCLKLKELDLIGFDTSNVTNMSYMFASCKGLSTSLDLASFDTRNVTNMASMFNGCTYLEKIYVGENWNTTKVTASNNVANVFAGCNNIEGGAGTILRK